MYKATLAHVLAAVSVLVIVPLSVSAQDNGSYNTFEFAAGYSHARVESTGGIQTFVGADGFELSFEPCGIDGLDNYGSNFQGFFCDRRGFNLLNSSVAVNLSRYVGLKGEFSAHRKSDTFVDTFEGVQTDTNHTTERIYQFLGGVQLKNNGTASNVKPYVHALAGIARRSVTDVQTSTDDFFDFTLREHANTLAMKFGGGLDVRAGRRVDLRVIDVNYNPIFGRSRSNVGAPEFTANLTGRTAHNFSVGAGVVLH